MSSTGKKIRSLAITVIAVAAINFILSFTLPLQASNIEKSPGDTPTSMAPAIPQAPRPIAMAPAIPRAPRPVA